MLTTIDNPYNPFEEFTSWLLFDKEKGYYSCERLMRLADKYIFDGMSQAELDEAVDKAMDELIELDILNLFVKVTKESVLDIIKQQNNNKQIEEISDSSTEIEEEAQETTDSDTEEV